MGFGSSAKAGLSLWQHLGVALALESLIAAAGLLLFLRGSKLSWWRKGQFTVFIFIIIALTSIGQSSAPPPDNITQVAAFSLFLNLGIALFAAFTTSIDKAKPLRKIS
jgi:quinol-cytochrome oxidoreductase complex cytochrome b subunit